MTSEAGLCFFDQLFLCCNASCATARCGTKDLSARVLVSGVADLATMQSEGAKAAWRRRVLDRAIFGFLSRVSTGHGSSAVYQR